jgi:chromosome segregation ATPase
VVETEEKLLAHLATLRRPIDLIRFLDGHVGGSWNRLAEQYEGLHRRLRALEQAIEGLQAQRVAQYERRRALRRQRSELEAAKGRHFREAIFERAASAEAVAARAEWIREIEGVNDGLEDVRAVMRRLRSEQIGLVNDPEVQEAHARRQAIELEAELKRMRMIRGAVTASRGLLASSQRPSAWWFRIVSPNGAWFRQTIDTADAYLEELS